MRIVGALTILIILGFLLFKTSKRVGSINSGVESIYGDDGIYGCAERHIESRQMPINTPEEIKAKKEFMKGCE